MSRLAKLPNEFTLAQWIRRPKALARLVLVCDCWRQPQSLKATAFGFRCRGRGSCGRYCCACQGGSERGAETLCAACANKRKPTNGR